MRCSAASYPGNGCSCSAGDSVCRSSQRCCFHHGHVCHDLCQSHVYKLKFGNRHVIPVWMQREAFHFRKQRRGSSGKTAHIPQLSTLQGIFKFGKRKNLPTHGIIQRHSQRRPGTNVSLFHLWTPLGWGRIKSLLAAAVATYMNCVCVISLGCQIQELEHRWILCLCRYQYVLGERTWIEYWPTKAECQTEEHRPTCLGMEEMQQQYLLFGCQQ